MNEKDRSVTKEAFCDEFFTNWENAVADERLNMIAQVRQLEPEEGVTFAIHAFQDLSRQVRQEARETLKKLAQKVRVSEDDRDSISREKALASEKFAQLISTEMKKTISLDELKEYLTLLLDINGRGPHFAWAFYLSNSVPHNVLIDILRRFPEHLRLRFVYVYVFSEISDRRRHALNIHLLLKEISDRQTALDFIKRILDSEPDCLTSALGLTGTLLYDFVDRLDLVGSEIRNGLYSDDPERVITAATFAGAFGRANRLYPFLEFLTPEHPEPLRLGLLSVLARSSVDGDMRVLTAVHDLIHDDNESVAIEAFNTLISLGANDMVATALYLIEHRPSMRRRLYKCLETMEVEDLIRLIERLPEAQAFDASRTLSRALLKKNPEKMDVLFGSFKTSADDETRKATRSFFEIIHKIKKTELNRLEEELITVPISSAYFESKTPQAQIAKLLKAISGNQGEKKLDLRDSVINGADFSGLTIENLDLRDAVFVDCNFSLARIEGCRFNGARFSGLSLNHAFIEKCDFTGCQFEHIMGEAVQIRQCVFFDSFLHQVQFGFSEIQECYFTGASMFKCDFSHSDLSFCNFTGALLGLSDFSHVSVFRTDFDYTKASLCEFRGTCFSLALLSGHTDLDNRSELWDDLDIPMVFFEKKNLETRWLNILILTHAMDRQREIFLRHNDRTRERALDSFRPEQEDLFELVPFLIHLTQRLLPIEKKGEDTYLIENITLKNASSGIRNYTPSPKTVRLAKKYLRVDKLLLLPSKDCNIDALFTIGSIGTIAQSSDSDLDYWVCIDKDRMGEDAVELLKLKLESIERWAKIRFGTELHFFVADPKDVKDGLFGGSDFESSGSAQGMILKEEFYRTLILVAGKIPFWNVLPSWTDNRYYDLLYSLACRFGQDYLDLGNVNFIPAGEYFGASMWQLFKSLTSPYKSVMKMGLLEKYIHEGNKGQLLCNKLKGLWASGKYRFLKQDPYILLLDEITDFYKKQGRDDIVALVRGCFFLKLGVRSDKHLEQSVFKMRKLMLDRCVERYGWDKGQVFDLGHFDEWSYGKILELSRQINGFMIETYHRLSGSLNHAPEMETMITSQDLTILGRKMFVQFSSHPTKVKTLPHVARGRTLFKQLYLYYRQIPRKQPLWDVYPYYDKKAMVKGNDWAVLMDVEEIEEVAAWVIHNGVYQAGTQFNILPNPSSVSAQDFQELLKDMNDFFVFGEGDGMPPESFLESFKMYRLYLIVNFTQDRKSERIREFAAVYMTTWGEMFCRKYKSRSGLQTISEAVDKVERDLGLSCKDVAIGYHIPKMSKKRIQDM